MAFLDMVITGEVPLEKGRTKGILDDISDSTIAKDVEGEDDGEKDNISRKVKFL